MPNWKKVVVSGSDATLNSLHATGPITGSDIKINDWGSVSASLAAIEAGATSTTLQEVTDNGATTTNNISILTGSLTIISSSFGPYAGGQASSLTIDPQGTPQGRAIYVHRRSSGVYNNPNNQPLGIWLTNSGSANVNGGMNYLYMSTTVRTGSGDVTYTGGFTYGHQNEPTLQIDTGKGVRLFLTGSGAYAGDTAKYVFGGGTSNTTASLYWNIGFDSQPYLFVEKVPGKDTRFYGTASYALSAATASYVASASYANYATSASYASTSAGSTSNFNVAGNLIVTGSISSLEGTRAILKRTITDGNNHDLTGNVDASTYYGGTIQYTISNNDQNKLRTGHVMWVTDGNDVSLTETTTAGIGDTHGVTIAGSINSGNVDILMYNNSGEDITVVWDLTLMDFS